MKKFRKEKSLYVTKRREAYKNKKWDLYREFVIKETDGEEKLIQKEIDIIEKLYGLEEGIFNSSTSHYQDEEDTNFKLMQITADIKGKLIDETLSMLTKPVMIEAYKVQLKI